MRAQFRVFVCDVLRVIMRAQLGNPSTLYAYDSLLYLVSILLRPHLLAYVHSKPHTFNLVSHLDYLKCECIIAPLLYCGVELLVRCTLCLTMFGRLTHTLMPISFRNHICHRQLAAQIRSLHPIAGNIIHVSSICTLLRCSIAIWFTHARCPIARARCATSTCSVSGHYCPPCWSRLIHVCVLR
jgi:hypothetical protein